MTESILTAAAGTTGTPALAGLLLCACASLALGLVLACMYMFRSHHTRSFATALAVLPAIVCVVIMMVNGNLGAGVAVAGAFSLVRFRSAPGSARDIGFIFLGMCVGLVAGMGYLAYAAIVTLLIGGALVVLQAANFGAAEASPERRLRVTVPEDLDFAGAFDDLLARYTTYHRLVQVKTTNMGSLYKLSYDICLRDTAQEKLFIDEIRVRNANLEVSLSEMAESGAEL